MKKAIQSRRVVTPEGIRPAAIVFEDGVVTSIEQHSSREATDFGDQYILPGLVDTHVHINEPGRTEWEGFQTATRAAAAGGFTCLVDMPLNSIPATTNVSALEQKRACAKGQSTVDYAFWGGSVHGNSGELAALAAAGVCGFKCFMVPSGVDEFEMVSEADLRLAMPAIAATGLPLLVHAEFPAALLDSFGQTWISYSDYLASRPDASELQAIELLIRLSREYKCPIHIVHLASAEPLSLLFAGQVLPFLLVFWPQPKSLWLGGCVLVGICAAWLPRLLGIGRFRQDWRGALLHPLGILLLLSVQWYAFGRKLMGGAVSWKARTYAPGQEPDSHRE